MMEGNQKLCDRRYLHDMLQGIRTNHQGPMPFDTPLGEALRIESRLALLAGGIAGDVNAEGGWLSGCNGR